MNYCPECGNALMVREIDGRSRQACSSCPYVFWENPTPVVAGIVELDGNVILVRNAGWPEKMFGLVSGFLEKGETPETAIVREIGEELGLAGEIQEYVGHYSFLERNQLILVFHVKSRGEVVLGQELAEFRRVSPEKLRPWPFGTGPAVRDWLVRKGFNPK